MYVFDEFLYTFVTKNSVEACWGVFVKEADIAMSANPPDVFRSQTDIIEILRALDYGTAMFRFKGRREPLRKLFCLKLETFEIQQFPITSSHSKRSPQPEEYGIILGLYTVHYSFLVDSKCAGD